MATLIDMPGGQNELIDMPSGRCRGDAVHQLVTTDFELHSPYVGHYFAQPSITVQKLLEWMVLLNVATTFPMFVLSLQDIFCSSILPGNHRTSPSVRSCEPSPLDTFPWTLSLENNVFLYLLDP